MAVFRPFRAYRPAANNENYIPTLPYDSLGLDEIRDMVRGNTLSFMHIERAEMDLPDGAGNYSDEVYEKAKNNLEMLENTGALMQDVEPYFYIYRQIRDGKEQVGLVGCASIDDYLNNSIKKHEKTLEKKEKAIVRFIDKINANTGAIFLTYRKRPRIDFLLSVWMNENDPVYDLEYDNVEQTVWVIDNPEFISKLSELFSDIDSLYIADGHHRCASAVEVGQKRRIEKGTYDENDEFNYFLAVAFPDDDLQIMDYNRLVKDLNGYTKDDFICRVSDNFDVRKETERYKPFEKHTYGMYIDGEWYSLRAKANIIDKENPVKELDVSILQDNILKPILGIENPKNDERIEFVSGIEGFRELERRVYKDMTVAFAMYPTTLEELMAIADAGEIMPPKSTWFEPKLLSGLFVHNLY